MTQGDRSSAGDGPRATLARGNPSGMPQAPELEPSTGSLSAVWTLAAITLTRLRRGKAPWIGALIATLPVMYAGAIRIGEFQASPGDVFAIEVLLLAILPAMFVAASLGEELETRTSAYLWSRPIERWALVAGKLCALAPVVVVLMAGSWWIASQLAVHAMPSAASLVAITAATIATSLIAAGIATVVPRFAMVLSIGYLMLDLFLGALPFSIDAVSITHQARAMAGLASGLSGPAYASSAIAMLVITGIWAAIGLLRIRRLEV